MRSFTLVSLAATCAHAGTVSVPFSKQQFEHSLNVGKRDTLNLDAFNNITGGGYYAEFEIGTPGQKLHFLLDTGSSDTWVNSVDTDLCNSISLQRTNGFCLATFNPDDSSTFKEFDKGGFDITYLDTRQIKGDYIKDSVTIDGKTVKSQQLGLATKSVSPAGIMGLGFDTNVAADTKYATILDNMVEQGYINTRAFSLYLNSIDQNSGTVLFGGIDTQKFIGSLTTLPLKPDFQSSSNNITSFTVGMDSFTVSGKSGLRLSKLSADAILDSGSTICLLPDSQVQDIWSAFDVRTVSGISVNFVDCAYADSKGDGITFDFTFSGKTIQVPMSQMVIDSFADAQSQIMNDPTLSRIFDGWKGACMFGIGSAEDYGVSDTNFALLGDTFLRSAYVVYDLANEQIGIAEANTGSNDSQIVEIKSGDKDLPSATGVSSKSTATGTRPTVYVTASSDGSSGNDKDSAAGQLSAVPAVIASLMAALGAAAIVL